MRDKKLIQLYITNQCNSHCKTCGIWKNKEQQELSITDIIRTVMAYSEADFVIGGGEAILHSRIGHILEFLKYKNINYTLLSNCICFELLEGLVKRHKVPAVTVSCDGINHDEIRGTKDNLIKIKWFKKICDEIGTKFKISYTYSKYNEKTFQQDMDMFRNDMGLDEIYFCLAQDMDLLMTDKTREDFEASNIEQILDCDLISKKDKRHVRSMITDMRRSCTSQSNVHTIYSNGDIVRCQSFKSNHVLGNVCEMPADEIRKVLDLVKDERCQYDLDCNLLCQRRYD